MFFNIWKYNDKTITKKSISSKNKEQTILCNFLKHGFISSNDTTIMKPHILQSFNNQPSFLDPIFYLLIKINFYSWYNFFIKTQPRKQNIAKKYIRNHHMNSSIDPVLLDRTKMKEILEDPKNELEASWRRRFLIENTSRGNIIMYYDIYKEAFAYYSDQSGIPYKVLNIVAMKYVIKFRCVDFFIDEYVMGGANYNPSLFITQNQQEKSTEKKISLNDKIAAAVAAENNPFIKSKVNTSNTQQQIEKPLFKNRFVYMGKITNFSILQKTPKRIPGISAKDLSKFSSQYSDMFGLQNEAQKNCMGYKSFKNIKNQMDLSFSVSNESLEIL